MLSALGRAQAAKILKAQLFVCAAVALAFGLINGFNAGYSALWGGLICLISNLFFFYQAFKKAGASKAQQIMRGFVWGQLGKFLITVGLFILAFVLGNVQPLPLFLGFLLVQSVFWISPILLKQRVNVNE